MALKIELLCLGKTKQQFVKLAETEYFQRIKKLASVRVIELEVPGSFSGQDSARKTREGREFLRKLKPDSFLVILDEGGKTVSSVELARVIEDKMSGGFSHITFGIGGASGFDERVLKRANLVLSLSKLTFSYQLARLIICEQIYRIVSIIQKSPYHK